MSEQITLELQARETQGTAASRRLRRVEHMIPGVIYGEAKDAESVMIPDVDFNKALQEESFFSQVLNVKLGKQQIAAVVKDLQRHPASNRVLHFDLLRISEDNEIHVPVPIHFINEESCVGVKLGGGNIARSITELEIRCLPRHLPEYIEVDLAAVEAGQTVHLSDITLPEGVELLHPADREHDSPVVSVTTRRGGQVEEESEATEAAESEQSEES